MACVACVARQGAWNKTSETRSVHPTAFSMTYSSEIPKTAFGKRFQRDPLPVVWAVALTLWLGRASVD
jgi:hypothetical protein